MACVNHTTVSSCSSMVARYALSTTWRIFLFMAFLLSPWSGSPACCRRPRPSSRNRPGSPAPPLPPRLAALHETVDHDVDRGGHHARIEAVRGDAPLPQREFVGQDLDARPGHGVQGRRLRAPARREDAVLDEEEGHRRSFPGQARGQIVEVRGHVAGFQRVTGLDEQVAVHPSVPPWPAVSGEPVNTALSQRERGPLTLPSPQRGEGSKKEHCGSCLDGPSVEVLSVVTYATPESP